jgi:hypothetical protein
MKNLKFIYGVIAIGLLTFVIYSCTKDVQPYGSNFHNVTQSLSGDSIPQPFGCAFFSGSPCIDRTKTFKVLNVAGYPGCSFTMKVDYCENSNIIIKKVELLTYTCQSYADSLDYFANTPNTLDDADFENRTNAKFLSKLEDYFFALSGGYIQCEQDPAFTVSSVSAQCRSICYFNLKQEIIIKDTIIIIGDGDGSGELGSGSSIENRGPKSIAKSSACSTDGCCLRETKMCYDPVTGQVVKTTTNTALGTPNCNGASPTPTFDPTLLELVRCTPCQFSCPD